MRTLIHTLGRLLVFVAVFAPLSFGAVPLLVNYQGSITDSAGNPIIDTLDVTFKIYIDSTTPTPEWTEVHPDIPFGLSTGAFEIGFHTGIISVQLASFTQFPDDLFDNDELWLGVTIGADPEISPRTQLVTVPYAFRAEGVSGHILTAPSSLFIPNLANTDTLISFTPGSVTFEGVPVDFSGTEASWLSTTSDTVVKIDTTGISLPGTGSGSVRITADSFTILSGSGTLRVNDGKLKFEPGGGGPGGRIIITEEQTTLTDDVAIDSLVIHRTDGLVLVVGASGTSAVYNAAGVQLTGPTARKFAANPNSISATRPSTNDAWSYSLDDASDLYHCDLDDDAVRDIRFQHTPSKELHISTGTALVCDGPTSLSSCAVAGVSTFASKATFSDSLIVIGPAVVSGDLKVESGTFELLGGGTVAGGIKIEDGATFIDPNKDAIDDIIISATPTPTMTLAAGTELDCLGPAFFSSPVSMASDLTVAGSFMATGAKMFVQQHPADESKEIYYVALEGNEAGTYTRGSGRLSDGVAEIQLPEDFALVTNVEGLTAQITPRGPVQSMLYVESVTPTMLVVKASNKKDGDVGFDFMINGVRAGFEDHQVIREKKSYASSD